MLLLAVGADQPVDPRMTVDPAVIGEDTGVLVAHLVDLVGEPHLVEQLVRLYHLRVELKGPAKVSWTDIGRHIVRLVAHPGVVGLPKLPLPSIVKTSTTTQTQTQREKGKETIQSRPLARRQMLPG